MLRRLMVIGIVVATMLMSGVLVAFAIGGDLFDQAASASDLEAARGVVFDVVPEGPPGVPFEIFISGEWTLDCGDACVEADLDNIEFDMAHVMLITDGNGSHSHT